MWVKNHKDKVNQFKVNLGVIEIKKYIKQIMINNQQIFNILIKLVQKFFLEYLI